MERLLCVCIGYAFGLIQTGYLYGKLNHIDIREHGSGNAGTTNALRTLGWKAGAVTFLGDCLKCVFAVLLVRMIFAQSQADALPLLAMYAGVGTVIGHNYPFYLKFKGGKGIAVTAGLILSTNFVMALIALVVFVSLVAVTKYVSVGSIAVVFLFLTEIVVYGQMGGFQMEPILLHELYGVVVLLVILTVFKHRENIKRLRKGTENKLGSSKQSSEVKK